VADSLLQKSILAGLILIIILVPLVFSLDIATYNLPKELVFEILISFLLFLSILLISLREKFEWSYTPLNLWIFIFIFFIAFSSLAAVNKYIVFENLFLWLCCFIFFFIIVNFVKYDQIKILLLIFLICGAAISTYGILQVRGIDFSFIRKTRLPFSTLGNINFAAQYLITLIPLSIFFVYTSKSRLPKLIFASIIAFLLIVHLILTRCRGGWLGVFGGVLISFFIWGYIYLRQRKTEEGIRERKNIFITLLPYCLIAVLILIIPGLLTTIKKTIISFFKIHTDFNILFRFRVWQDILRALSGNIFLLVGFRNFEFAYMPYMTEVGWRASGAKLIVETAHNEYLQLVMEIGWWGAVVFIIVLGILIKMILDLVLKRVKNREELTILLGLLGGIIATIIHAGFSSNFQKPASLVQFWFLAGIAGVYYREKNRPFIKIVSIKNILKIAFVSLGAIMVILTGWFSWIRFKSDKFLEEGYRYAAAKKWSKAVGCYQQSIFYLPYKYRAYFLCGDAFMVLGLPDKENYYNMALDYYQKAGQLNPYYPNIYYNMAALYLNMREYDKAIEQYKKALKINPVYEMALIDMGYLCIKLRKYKDAKIVYEKAVRIKPDNLNFNRNLGRIYSELKDAKNYIDIFKRCTKLSPNSAEMWTELGNAYVMGRNLNKAKEAYEKAMELNPGYAPVYNNLAYNIYIKKGRPNTKAIKLLNKALKLWPENPLFLDSLGWAYYNSNNMKEAERYILKAIKLDPRQSVLYEHLGDIYLATGKREETIKSWRKALILDPNNRDLRGRLFIIRKLGDGRKNRK
jgi:tetratricopeptide (TPR) repeat protein/O-antigen ligase